MTETRVVYVEPNNMTVRYSLDEIGDVFAREAEASDTQGSLKTIIWP